jgi:hypothetical protein
LNVDLVVLLSIYSAENLSRNNLVFYKHAGLYRRFDITCDNNCFTVDLLSTYSADVFFSLDIADSLFSNFLEEKVILNNKLNKQSKWYKSIVDNMSSGFLSIKIHCLY